MEIGTIETIELPDEEKKKPRSRMTGGSGGPSGGGGKNNGGGGGDRNDDSAEEDVQSFIPQKSKLIVGFLLVAVLMTFSGLIAAYVVIATNGAIEWKPFNLPVPVWISTVLILASSVTYHIAKKSFDSGDQIGAKKWLLVTTVLGGTFISSQILAWTELVRRGLYMQSNPYAGFFYILTALHAVHVLGGIIALGSVILRSWYVTGDDEELLRRRTLARVTGWYWHFMGGLWIVLFLLLGFWK